jgi:hypothetical protein
MSALAIECGFVAPCVLMLTALAMNFRYRLEFFPLIEFGAFLGFSRYVVLLSRPWRARCQEFPSRSQRWEFWDRY